MTVHTNALPDIDELRAFLGEACRRDDLPLAAFLRSYWLEENHAARLPFLLQEVAPLLETDHRVLDVGSFGEWLLLLWRYLGLSDVHACSLEGGYLAYGDGTLKADGEAGHEFELPIAEVDVETEPLPYEDGRFDVVTCFEVLEHLRTDPVFMLDQFNRVLGDGGLL